MWISTPRNCISLALAGAVMLTGGLAACGGDDDGGKDSEYCKDAKKAAPTFKSFGDGDVAKADSAFAMVHNLADEAPGDVKKDWEKLDDIIKTAEKAFEDAGLEFSDLDEIQKGEVPEGVDVSELANLGKEFQKLSDEEYTDAAKRIDAHALKVCEVSLHVNS